MTGKRQHRIFDKIVESEDCKMQILCFMFKMWRQRSQQNEVENDTWYCSNCKADCDLCKHMVLPCHKAVQCEQTGVSSGFIVNFLFLCSSLSDYM